MGEIIKWGAQSVRATVFASLHNIRIDDLYAKAVGQRPDVYQAQAALGALGHAAGQCSFGQVALTAGPGRLDVALSPQSPPLIGVPVGTSAQTTQLHQSIQDVSGSVEFICQCIKKVALEFSGIDRIAMFQDLVDPYLNLQDANSSLSSALPYSIILGEVEDFVLQRNDKYTFESHNGEKILVNSLSRWATIPVQQMNINIGVNGLPQASGQLLSQYYLAQKISDINTASPLRDVSADTISGLFDEFKRRAQQLRQVS